MLTRDFGAQDRKNGACSILDELEAMKLFDAAFESAYGMTLQRFEERWSASIRRNIAEVRASVVRRWCASGETRQQQESKAR